ncbi:hypothetical protein Lser_V15G11905 [Lactuca serriola]
MWIFSTLSQPLLDMVLVPEAILKSLTVLLYLDVNKLSGPIPTGLGNLKSLTVLLILTLARISLVAAYHQSLKNQLN